MGFIIKKLFSKRNQDKEKKKARDIFSRKQFKHICKLMLQYGVNTYNQPPYTGFSFQNAYNSQIVYNTLDNFYNKADYKTEKEFDGTLNDMGEVCLYFIGCKLYSLFDSIEVYCLCLGEACDLVGEDYPLQEFIKDFNDYLEENEIAYRLVINEGKPEIQKKTLPYAEERLLELEALFSNKKEFKQVEKDFNKALSRNTRGKYPAAVRACNNALESLLKIMGGGGKSTTSLYKDVVKTYNLPEIITDKYKHLQKLISFIEKMRSRIGDSHGGENEYEIKDIDFVTELIINLTASFIIYLIRQYQRKKK